MSSRLMHALLKLYPRRIRKRYGDELLDLQSELAAKGDLSRTRLIRDVFAGALLVRSARQRAHVVIGAVLLMVGLAIAVTIISAPGINPPARASHPELRLAVKSPNAIPYGSCFAGSSSWSLTGTAGGGSKKETCTTTGPAMCVPTTAPAVPTTAPANMVAPSGTSITQSGPSCPRGTVSAVPISTTTPSGRPTTALPTTALPTAPTN